MSKDKNKLLKKLSFIILDALFVSLSGFLACYFTMEGYNFGRVFCIWIAANFVLLVVFFSILKIYRIMYRTITAVDALRICFGGILIFVSNIIFVFISGSKFIRVSTAVNFSTFLILFTLASRFFARSIMIMSQTTKVINKRVMIIGGGDAGAVIIKEMFSSNKISCYPVCILDDDVEKIGNVICGVSIVGNTHQIKQFVEKFNVDEIFITMPSVPNKVKSEIVNRCKDCGKPVKILPGLYQFTDGQISVSNLREVDVADLLGREQVKVNIEEIIKYIENQVVLVTGGGGSIGSELCRQIATHNPKRLIILDIYENNAYDIEQELKRKCKDLDLVTLIASIRDKGKLEDVFTKFKPDIVFNAAAHKHVPLMETSPNEAIKNNVFGTLNMAKCADKFGVKTFVQISTDKAVNPTNIMGASKRICEMIIQQIGKKSKTKFVAVRFGNVLGSNGSVIPLFKKQILEGGPVTVTHKDIIRYFMTIPEAVSLVLEAGAYAKGGQIFVLDMGEPVKIYDLAYNLIKLSGLKPNEDIEIVCTGLRPGEKLFEERLMDEEGLEKTANGSISVAKPIELDEDAFWKTLDLLYEKAYSETDEMKNLVHNLVPTYKVDLSAEKIISEKTK